MAIKTHVGVFSVYHEEYERVMRCVYDSANAMVVGYVDIPPDNDEEAREEYVAKVTALKSKHTEWAKTATLDDVVTVNLKADTELYTVTHASKK